MLDGSRSEQKISEIGKLLQPLSKNQQKVESEVSNQVRSNGPDFRTAFAVAQRFNRPIIPLIGKEPYIAGGFNSGSSDEAQWKEWASWGKVTGFGLVTGGEIAVLDVDSNTSLTQLESDLNQNLHNTFTVTTGSGKQHLYFEGTIDSENDWRPGLDLRGEKGYVVLPGSIHPDTKQQYKITNDVPINKLKFDPSQYRVVKESFDEWKAKQNKSEIAVEGRNNSLTKEAGVLRNLGKSTDEVLEHLLVSNSRFAEPLSKEEVEKIAKSSGNFEEHSARMQALERLKNSDWAKNTLAEEKAIEESYGFKWEFGTLGKKLRDNVKPAKVVIENFLKEKEDMLIVADVGTGKTTFAVNLAKSLATGGLFLGKYKIDHPGAVAFMNYEMAEVGIYDWLKKHGGEEYQWDDGRVDVFSLDGINSNLFSPYVFNGLVEGLKTAGTKTLIIDTWTRIIAACGLTESPHDAPKMLKKLGELKKLANLDHVITIGHPAKGSTTGEIRDAGAVLAPASTWIHLTKTESGTRKIVYKKNRGFGDLMPDVELAFDSDTLTLTVSGIKTKPKMVGPSYNLSLDKVNKMAEIIAKEPGRNKAYYRAKLGGRNETNGQIIDYLLSQDRIKLQRDNTYTPADLSGVLTMLDKLSESSNE